MNYPHSDAPHGERINHWQKHVPVISTGHITKEDGEIILMEGHPYILDKADDGAWTLVKTSFAHWQGGGISPDFRELLQHFESRGYPWIILDRDGEIVEGLPTFEW